MRRRARAARSYALALSALALAAAAVYVLSLPDVEALKRFNPKTTAFIALREREAARAGVKFRKSMTWVPLEQVSEHLRHAVVLSEDAAFYRHGGVDWENVRAAARKDIERGSFAFGASTITQQLARNLYLSPSKNPLRKLKELLIARRLEKALGKRRILELYLNVVEWGRGIFGAEAASRAYFGKHASELAPEEAAALAVVLPSPRRLNPAKKSRTVERRVGRVIARMRKSGYLPEEAQESLSDEDLAELELVIAPAPP